MSLVCNINIVYIILCKRRSIDGLGAFHIIAGSIRKGDKDTLDLRNFLPLDNPIIFKLILRDFSENK